MKDNFLLFVTAITMSALAWFYWHLAGKDAVGILTSILLLVLIVDNFQLRRQLRKARQVKKD